MSPPPPNLLALAGLGLLLGFRHAFEPDHLAAVSTLATRQGRLLDACRLGLAWALGHTASVGLVVGAIILFGLHLPDRLWPAADLLVALLLIALGGTVILRYARGRWHLHAHSHAGGPHLHLHSHTHGTAHEHAHPQGDARGVAVAREHRTARLDAGRALGDAAPCGQRGGEHRRGAAPGWPRGRRVLALRAAASRLARSPSTPGLPGCLCSGRRNAVHAPRGLPYLVDADRGVRRRVG